MKFKEAINTIEIIAKAHGFTTKKTQYSEFPVIESENMIFNIDGDKHFNLEKRTLTTTITARASISRMGGNPTTEELFKVANEIQRGAVLVDSINLMNMVIEETFDEVYERESER